MNSGEGETLQELQAYRAKVYDEVVRRVEVVQGVERELSAAEFDLTRADQGARAPLTSAADLQRQAARRGTLQKQRDDLLKKRQQAMEDLERAKERLIEVDEQIRAAEVQEG
jgi:hypothetical protein